MSQMQHSLIRLTVICFIRLKYTKLKTFVKGARVFELVLLIEILIFLEASRRRLKKQNWKE